LKLREFGGRRKRYVQLPRHVDTGGTFSDFVFFSEDTGEITITKVPSTPKEPFQAV
jgi:N-methylhydantoinase A/oxoprolinase/acetone carboxylase beta subunit